MIFLAHCNAPPTPNRRANQLLCCTIMAPAVAILRPAGANMGPKIAPVAEPSMIPMPAPIPTPATQENCVGLKFGTKDCKKTNRTKTCLRQKQRREGRRASGCTITYPEEGLLCRPLLIFGQESRKGHNDESEFRDHECWSGGLCARQLTYCVKSSVS